MNKCTTCAAPLKTMGARRCISCNNKARERRNPDHCTTCQQPAPKPRKGLCTACYQKAWGQSRPRTCKVGECSRCSQTLEILAKGLCHKCYGRARYQTNPTYRDQVKAHSKANPNRRKGHLWQKYGLTQEDYQALLAAQGGTCATCSATDQLCVDHCHATGQVRGILCFVCNTRLGHFEASRATFQEAFPRYLSAPPARSIIPATGPTPP